VKYGSLIPLPQERYVFLQRVSWGEERTPTQGLFWSAPSWAA